VNARSTRVSYEGVLDRILTHLGENLERPLAGPLSAESHLVRDVGLDSMESVQMLSDLEDHFEITLPVQLLRDVETLGDVARAVSGALSPAGPM
jgi:acyl carrier protein